MNRMHPFRTFLTGVGGFVGERLGKKMQVWLDPHSTFAAIWNLNLLVAQGACLGVTI